jgi:hypothetical protein
MSPSTNGPPRGPNSAHGDSSPLENDARLVEAVRGISGDAPDAAAMAAIADGAWARAQGHHKRAPRNLLFLRPLGLVAAALLICAVVWNTFTPEPALAVDGDHMDVWAKGAWKSDSQVRPGEWIFTPSGTRRVRFENGSSIQPEPGTVFRIESRDIDGSNSEMPFRVEIRRGSVAYDGNPLSLRVSDVDVTPKPRNGFLSLAVSSNDDTRVAPVSPDAVLRALRSLPRVAVSSGSVVVRVRDTGESMELGQAQAATLFATGGSGGVHRLTRLRSWSQDVPADVIKGNLVIDASPTENGGAMVLLGGRFPETVEISPAQRAQAFASLNLAMDVCNALLADLELDIDMEATGPSRWRLSEGGRQKISMRFPIATQLPRAIYHETDITLEERGVRTKWHLSADGSCALLTDGSTQTYSSFPLFEKAHPQLAEMFRPHLRKQ